MKTLKVIGNLFKAAITIAVAGTAAKILLSWLYGYRRADASYGGSYFYNWRAKYMDKKLVKGEYARSKMNEQPVDKIFSRYVDMTQGTTRHHAVSYDPKTRKTTYGAERTEYPYYAYGFPDTFVLGPKKTWTLFKNDPKALDLEFRFLQLRGRFISALYKIKFSLDSLFFEKPAPPKETSAQKKARKSKAGKPLKKGLNFQKLNGKMSYSSLITQRIATSSMSQPFCPF